MREVLNHEQKASLAVHLGDFLDYSCESEWIKASDALIGSSSPKLLILPGNHDGLFQGNSEYGTAFKVGLWLRWIFNRSYDPTLQSHFNSVCHVQYKPRVKYANYNLRKRDYFCSYYQYLAENLAVSSEDIEQACLHVAQARLGPIDGSSKAVIHYPSTGAFTSLQSETNFDFGYVARFESSKTDSWSKGYFVQVARLQGNNKERQVHLLLVDTTDWDQSPAYALLGKVCHDAQNSNCGMIGSQQSSAVDQYISELPYGSNIVLAGHYPLAQMQSQSAGWIKRIIEKDPAHRVYVSAHTHSGYINALQTDGQPKTSYEINSDSLIDWPSSYWKMEVNPNNSMCFVPGDPWAELGCSQVLSSEHGLIVHAVERYKADLKSSFFDQGKRQWRWRAEDAYRAMTSFIARRGLPIACHRPDFDRDKSVDISRIVQDCQDRLDAAISQDNSLRVAAACTSLLGGASFVNKKPGGIIRENYHNQCLQ
jgi:hypothetical protein